MPNLAQIGFDQIANDPRLEEAEKREAKIYHINEVKKDNILSLFNTTSIDGEKQKDEKARELLAFVLENSFELDPTKYVKEADKEKAILANEAAKEVFTMLKAAMQDNIISGDMKACHCVQYATQYS